MESLWFPVLYFAIALFGLLGPLVASAGVIALMLYFRPREPIGWLSVCSPPLLAIAASITVGCVPIAIKAAFGVFSPMTDKWPDAAIMLAMMGATAVGTGIMSGSFAYLLAGGGALLWPKARAQGPWLARSVAFAGALFLLASAAAAVVLVFSAHAMSQGGTSTLHGE